jgi:acetyl esterase/lipase
LNFTFAKIVELSFMRLLPAKIFLAGLCAVFISAEPCVALDMKPYVSRGVELHTSKTARNVIYGKAENVELKMDIYFPSNEEGKPVPAVMFVHGGGWSVGDKSRMTFPQLLPLLLKRGYLVASINYRLAPKYKFPAQIEDAKCAVRFLRAHAGEFNLVPNRIGVEGESAGGHLVALLGLTDAGAGFEGNGGWSGQSSRVEAVADLFGPADLTNFGIKSNGDYRATAEDVFGATFDGDPVLKRASPVTYISKNAPPFLLLHGNRDEVVPLGQSLELDEKLKAAGVSSTLVIVTNYAHGGTPIGMKTSPPASEIPKIIADFFDRTLKK